MPPEPRTAWSSAFPSTHWSVVLAAGSPDGTTGFAALAEICGAYWHPLYAFARKLGYPPADAQDLVQGFFASMLERPFLDRADATKGRFRSFLLGAFKNYLGKQKERQRAQKRAGAHPHLPFDTLEAEARCAAEGPKAQSPELCFERAWALAMLEEAMRRLEAACRQADRLDLFRELQPCLEGDTPTPTYAQIAARLGTTEGAIRVTVMRLRRHYLESLRSVVRQTVEGPAEVEAELRHLLAVLKA